MRYFLDSCVCIEFMRGRDEATLRGVLSHDPGEIAIPAVVAAELRYGARRSARAERESLITERFLSVFEEVPFDGACATHYGRMRLELERRGTIIGPNDLLIAATALAHGATLVTSNLREFARVPGLLVESWSEGRL